MTLPAPGIHRDLPAADQLDVAVAYVQPQVSVDYIAEVADRLAAYMQRGRELQKLLDQQIMEYIRANVGEDGEVVVGFYRHWIGHPKDTKCRDVTAALEALLIKSGGDFNAVAACLSVNAIKPGAARVVLGDEWDRHFEVTVKDKLEKELMKVDTRFLK